MTASPMLVFGGLAFTRAEHVAIIVALQPSMTALADWLVHRRRPGTSRWRASRSHSSG